MKVKTFSKDWWNPRVKAGLRWWHLHVITGTLVVIAFFLALLFGGYWAYHQLNASHFTYRCEQYRGSVCVKHTGFRATVPIPTKTEPIHIRAVYSVPPALKLDLSYLPGVTTQDGLGACNAFNIYNYILPYSYNTHYNYRWGTTNRPKRFSSRFAYSYDTNGVDSGSGPADEVDIAKTVGIPLWRYYPYGNNPYGLPAYADETRAQIPAPVYAHAQKYSINTYVAFQFPGAGYGGVTQLKSYMSQYRVPAALALPVYPEWDNASLTGGRVGSPLISEHSRGGHAVSVIGWNDNILIGNGDGTYSRGAFIGVNQWGRDWGGTSSLGLNNGTNGGYFALSYDFVAKYAFEAEVYTFNWTNPTLDGNPRIGHLKTTAPAAPENNLYRPSDYTHNSSDNTLPTLFTAPKPVWYVHNVYTTSSPRIDLSPLLNYWGDKWNVAPVFLAAVAGTESNMNVYAQRWGIPPDVSFSLMQETVQTANGYGVYGDAYAVRSWEFIPDNSISLGAHILHDYISYNGVQPPAAYLSYNAGPGNPLWFYSSPTGQAATNYYGNFLPWYYFAIKNFGVNIKPTPPAPPKFPFYLWNSYRVKNHLSTISPYLSNHHLSWAASVWVSHTNLSGIKNKGQWFYKLGVFKTPFKNGSIYCWNKYHKCKVTLGNK